MDGSLPKSSGTTDKIKSSNRGGHINNQNYDKLQQGVNSTNKIFMDKIWHNCEKCFDPSELGSNASSLQCLCGGFYYKQDFESRVWKCWKCGKVEDLSEKFEIIENLQKTLENDPDNEVTEALIFVDREGLHENFFLTTKCYMKYVQK